MRKNIIFYCFDRKKGRYDGFFDHFRQFGVQLYVKWLKFIKNKAKISLFGVILAYF